MWNLKKKKYSSITQSSIALPDLYVAKNEILSYSIYSTCKAYLALLFLVGVPPFLTASSFLYYYFPGKTSVSTRFSLKWRDFISGNSLLKDHKIPVILEVLNSLTSLQLLSGGFQYLNKQLALSNAGMSLMTMNYFGPGVPESCQFWPRICWVYIQFLDLIPNPSIWISGFGNDPFVSPTVINYAVKNCVLI